MLRRLVSAAVVMLVVAGLALAGEYQGTITEISKDKIKITVGRKKGEEGTKKEFKVGKDVKVMRMKGKDDHVDADIKDIEKAIEKGKNNDKFRGVPAKIETEGEGDSEKVVKISIMAGGKKKKDN